MRGKTAQRLKDAAVSMIATKARNDPTWARLNNISLESLHPSEKPWKTWSKDPKAHAIWRSALRFVKRLHKTEGPKGNGKQLTDAGSRRRSLRLAGDTRLFKPSGLFDK
jgi:hypothetical protein